MVGNWAFHGVIKVVKEVLFNLYLRWVHIFICFKSMNFRILNSLDASLIIFSQSVQMWVFKQFRKVTTVFGVTFESIDFPSKALLALSHSAGGLASNSGWHSTAVLLLYKLAVYLVFLVHQFFLLWNTGSLCLHFHRLDGDLLTRFDVIHLSLWRLDKKTLNCVFLGGSSWPDVVRVHQFRNLTPIGSRMRWLI